METTIEKLEAMFQKSEADLDCIERRLKLDFINGAAEDGSSNEENLAAMLENLKAVKAKYSRLCADVKEITNAQKESMEDIRGNLSTLLELVKDCHQSADVEGGSLAELEQEAAVLLAAAGGTSSKEQVCSDVSSSIQHQTESSRPESHR